MNNEFQVYLDYIYLKKHFTDENFLWDEKATYRKIKPETFLKRSDATFFKALYNHYKDRKKIVDHLISCFLLDNNFWIGNALKDEYEYYHFNRMTRYGALERTFSNDAEKLENHLEDHEVSFESLLTPSTTLLPLMDLYGIILSMETLALLEHFTGFTRSWFPINPLQKWRRLLVYKYSKVLRLNSRDLTKIESVYHSLVSL